LIFIIKMDKLKNIVKEIYKEKYSPKSDSENLAEIISNTLQENTSYKEFAEAVALVLEKDYGSHNYKGFLEILNNKLSK